MSFNARSAFEKGLHGEVVKTILPPGKSAADTTALIGSLAFLGRLDEAVAIFDARVNALSDAARARCRFAIAVALTRISKFKSARRWLRENLRDPACTDQADVYQGLAFYQYYFGNFEKAAKRAKQSLQLALKNSDRYMHALAIDLYGHALVQTGRRSLGLQKLSESIALSKRTDAANPTAVAKLLYESEAGYRPQKMVSDLKSTIEKLGQDDSYSRANATLELARQLTLRGNWSEARSVLDVIAPAVYGFQNRRQEAVLQLRLSELSYRRGDAASAQHFLQAARRCLLKIADSAYEVKVLGLEAKLEKKLFGREMPPASRDRLNELSQMNPQSMSQRIFARVTGETHLENSDDPLGELLDRVAADSSAVDELIAEGYLGLVPEAKGWNAGAPTLALLPDGNWIAASQAGVSASVTALSPLSIRLLKALSRARLGKAELAKAGWSYDYDPLRHDPMIYTALAGLRRSLAPVGHWIFTEDEGWSLSDHGRRILFVDESTARPELSTSSEISDLSNSVAQAPVDQSLNWRQVKLLALKSTSDPWTVPSYKKQFKVSTMTAWRDLDRLAKSGYLRRLGRGRATVYLLVSTRRP